jgi:hypothetical protein
VNTSPRRTIDHDEIRQWGARHDATPQKFDNPAAGSDRPGIRLDFPGTLDDAFLPEGNPPQEIGWEEFFRLFEEQGLTFVYEDRPDVEDKSMLYRFELRDSPFGRSSSP